MTSPHPPAAGECSAEVCTDCTHPGNISWWSRIELIGFLNSFSLGYFPFPTAQSKKKSLCKNLTINQTQKCTFSINFNHL
jgi:hypothetical protein